MTTDASTRSPALLEPWAAASAAAGYAASAAAITLRYGVVSARVCAQRSRS